MDNINNTTDANSNSNGETNVVSSASNAASKSSAVSSDLPQTDRATDKKIDKNEKTADRAVDNVENVDNIADKCEVIGAKDEEDEEYFLNEEFDEKESDEDETQKGSDSDGIGDANEALQEARQILTEGRARENPFEKVLEESTTVQVLKVGSYCDPIEVLVSRSTVTSQPNTDDEEEEHERTALISGGFVLWVMLSKSPFYGIVEAPAELYHRFSRSRTNTYSQAITPAQQRQPHHTCCKHTHRRTSSYDESIQQQHQPATKNTTVKYRRKRGDSWRPSAGDAGSEDDAELEVKVEHMCVDEEGEHLVKKTWEAKWRVQKYEYLPGWLQDNEYLRHGHRPPLPSFAECFRSILSLHTETGNIWTHLIGCVAFALLATWFLTRPDTHIKFQEKIVFSFFFAGAILCLGASFAFHTVCCHSVAVVRIFCKLDYMGISLLIIGSFIPWVYYGFYCRREPKITYIAMVSVLGSGGVVVSLWDKFSESRFRPLRAGVFVAMGLSGVIPTIHFMITDGLKPLFAEAAFHWLLLMATLYIVGAVLYATRTPERFFPGKCDIWFQSHQLFHVCVVAAAFVHYYGISQMAMHRLTSPCPMDSAFHSMVEGVVKTVHDSL
ncbi:unnamed protein product [Anisakis simplex]|uniref:Progestin and adipoQ receptor-like protein 1 (inferred by orthology to a C. elegans protein) n=1 Tax=Anisakis simplex TaxID=6269 RepID=A0A0M3JYA4_ANISI|nr:unnamed protein product [Anisakis simplex]